MTITTIGLRTLIRYQKTSIVRSITLFSLLNDGGKNSLICYHGGEKCLLNMKEKKKLTKKIEKRISEKKINVHSIRWAEWLTGLLFFFLVDQLYDSIDRSDKQHCPPEFRRIRVNDHLRVAGLERVIVDRLVQHFLCSEFLV